MSIFNSFADTPEQIRLEGQEITLKFIRIDDETGKLTWNIPPSIEGCKGDGKYDGIVLTVSRVAANYIESSPKDGQYYIGDATVDPDLHAGSKIQDDVLVVGAFYNDRTTTELELTGLQPNTAYYFSGYAVDNVARYHREGVHSYSLPTGVEEGPPDDVTPANHMITLDEKIRLTQPTGLNPDQTYKLRLNVNDCEHEIEIIGGEAANYQQLIDVINEKLTLLDPDIYESPVFPFRNVIWLEDGIYYLWDGENKIKLDVIATDVAPNLLPAGTLWYDTDDNLLYEYNGPGSSAGAEWTLLDFVEYGFDITNPEDGTIWFDSTSGIARIWKNGIWCELNTVVSTRNPLLPVLIEGAAYWYNTTTGELTRLNKETSQWEEILAIYFDKDPEAIDVGDYWYDETNEKVFQLQSGLNWTEVTNVFFEETNSNVTERLSFRYVEDEFSLYRWNSSDEQWDKIPVIVNETNPNADPDVDDGVLGDYWFDTFKELLFKFESGGWVQVTNVIIESTNSYITEPYDFRYVEDEQALFEWSAMSLSWEEVAIASFPTDPRDRSSCQYWWDSSPSVDSLFSWDSLNSQWVEVDNFFQQATNPLEPEKLPNGTVWYNPETGVLTKILSEICEELNFINETFNPLNPPLGLYWLFNGQFYLYSESLEQWVLVDEQPIRSDTDPTDVEVGTYWLNTTTSELFQWDGTDWVLQEVADSDPKPAEGFLWYNTIEDQLYMWDAIRWTETTAFAFLEFVKGDGCSDMDTFVFKTRKRGCDAIIEVLDISGNVFGDISVNIRYKDPVPGQDIQKTKPMYKQLGVGDDGSPDERRELHRKIRELLGAPSTKVELSKSQIDVCIDNALKTLRKYSGYGYKRGFFFLDMKRNQQTYELSDKCVGFNKIVKVTAAYRLRSGFLKGAYTGYDIYGYAALKQLYTLGSFDLLSFHLVSSFIEELENLFATRLTFQWNEQTRELKMYNAIYADERILIDCSVERTEQDLMVDRNTTMWIQKWALAEAKMMLSQGRGKFQSLPGPNGNTVLNAQELITQSEAEKAGLLEELEDMSMADASEVGQHAYFIMG